MINTNHLLKVTSAWISVVYTICYLGVALFPGVRDFTMKYALHSDAPMSANYFGFGYFISGLIIWNIAVVLAVWLFAKLFNSIKQ